VVTVHATINACGFPVERVPETELLAAMVEDAPAPIVQVVRFSFVASLSLCQACRCSSTRVVCECVACFGYFCFVDLPRWRNLSARYSVGISVVVFLFVGELCLVSARKGPLFEMYFDSHTFADAFHFGPRRYFKGWVRGTRRYNI
jgi:hypothetical protein